jgi:hypothetical protein
MSVRAGRVRVAARARRRDGKRCVFPSFLPPTSSSLSSLLRSPSLLPQHPLASFTAHRARNGGRTYRMPAMRNMRRMRFRTQVRIFHLPSPTRLSSRTQPTQFPTCRTSNEHRLTATERAMDARRPHHPNSYSHLHLRPRHERLPAFAAATSRISSTPRKKLSRHRRASLHCTADSRPAAPVCVHSVRSTRTYAYSFAC